MPKNESSQPERTEVAAPNQECWSCAFAGNCNGHQCAIGHQSRPAESIRHISQMYGGASIPRAG
ncbi:MAG: hypothetical protein CMI56_02175 [Parcubacteria group bacterium]|nr:hypothetical protein [Parcubacteria group bacterium]